VTRAIDLSTTRRWRNIWVVGRAAKTQKPGDVIVSNSDGTRRNYEKSGCRPPASLIKFAPSIRSCWCVAGHEFVLNSAAFREMERHKEYAVAAGGEIPEGTGRRTQWRTWSTMRGRW